MVLEAFAKKEDIGLSEDKKISAVKGKGVVAGETVTLLAPNTFMNASGKAVAKVVKSIKAAEKLIVIYDDLDMPLGSIKLTFGGGSGGHKGVESIARALKTKNFIRVRVGISGQTPSGKLKKPKGEEQVIKHIMSDFGKNADLWTKVKKRAVTVLESILTDGFVRTQGEVNSKK